MMLVRTYVAKSDIEGVGVFAAEFIRRGTPVWQLDIRLDKVIATGDLADYPPHMQEYFTRYSFPHLDMPGHIVVEIDNGRFMNHTLAPNTDFTQFDKGWATRDIHPGEEITCNYHEFDPTFEGSFEAGELLPNGHAGHVNGSAGVSAAQP
jgi:hypothetical protein